MKLKMCTADKIFDKICLKAIRNISLQFVICNQGRDEVRHEGKRERSIFWWGVASNRKVNKK